MSPSWKYLLVGIVVAVALSSAALQAEAWWGSRGGGWGGAGCYGLGGSSVYCARLVALSRATLAAADVAVAACMPHRRLDAITTRPATHVAAWQRMAGLVGRVALVMPFAWTMRGKR